MLASALIFAIVFAVVFGRSEPYVVSASEIFPPKVKPGEAFTVIRHIKWVRHDCTILTIAAVLIDSLGVVHRLELEQRLLDWRVTEARRTLSVPFSMPAGRVRYRSNVEAFCFPFYSAWPLVIEYPLHPEIIFEVER